MNQVALCVVAAAIRGAVRRRNRRRDRAGKPPLWLEVTYYLADRDDEEGQNVSAEEFLGSREFDEPFLNVYLEEWLFSIHFKSKPALVSCLCSDRSDHIEVNLCESGGREGFGRWLSGLGLLLGVRSLDRLGDRLSRIPGSSLANARVISPLGLVGTGLPGVNEGALPELDPVNG